MIIVTKQAGNALAGGHATSPERQGSGEGNALRGGHATSVERQGSGEGNVLAGGHATSVERQGANQGNALGQDGPIYKGANQGNALGQDGPIYKGANQGNALGRNGTIYKGADQGNVGGRKQKRSIRYVSDPDPALAFNFFLQIDGLSDVEALFTECSGLKIKRKPHLYKAGGQNDFVYKFVDRTEYDDVKLKRGITASGYLWDWYLQGLDTNRVIKKNVTIILLSVDRVALKRWHLISAFPIEWSGPDLKTDASNVAFETITLTYERLTLGG